MSRIWQLQEAKNKLSEVVKRATSEGPQTISRRGVPIAVVISAQEFHRSERAGSLVDFFGQSPLHGIDLDLERHPDYGRDIVL